MHLNADSIKKITILIADDHRLIRDSWSYILSTDQRFDVITIAESGEQAVKFAEDLLPDIVLMDINLGGISGFEATEIINKVSPSSKIIAVSIHAIPAYVKKMFNQGASGYVTKNSPWEELVEAIFEVRKGKKFVCAEIRNIFEMQELQSDDNSQQINSLTKREFEVVEGIKSGLSSREIALRFGVSSKTIEVHRYNILKKLALPNTAALVNFVNSKGL